MVCEEPVVIVLVSSSPGPVFRRCKLGVVSVRDSDDAVRNDGGGCEDDDEAAT
jgi:hypothetical protein